jgi:hypothetical protein
MNQCLKLAAIEHGIIQWKKLYILKRQIMFQGKA